MGVSHMSDSPDELRKTLIDCLGCPWPAFSPLHSLVRETIQKDGYRLESIVYDSPSGLPEGGVDQIPAYFIVPDGVDADHPAPAVAIWHQHNGQYELGKSEPAGLAGNPMHHTGVALAKEGYVVLCPDALCFEERQDPSGRQKKGNYERFEFLRYVVSGKSLAWKNILDMKRAIDYLESRPEVKKDRMGCYGHSMGSTHTWLLGPHEPRLKAFLGNCCLPTYEAIHEHEILHCFPNFVPGWFQYGDTPEIAALTAPRALHLNFGGDDSGSPIDSVRRGLERIHAAYVKAAASDQFSSFIEAGVGHELSPAMWEQVKRFFEKNLKS